MFRYSFIRIEKKKKNTSNHPKPNVDQNPKQFQIQCKQMPMKSKGQYAYSFSKMKLCNTEGIMMKIFIVFSLLFIGIAICDIGWFAQQLSGSSW